MRISTPSPKSTSNLRWLLTCTAAAQVHARRLQVTPSHLFDPSLQRVATGTCVTLATCHHWRSTPWVYTLEGGVGGSGGGVLE